MPCFQVKGKTSQPASSPISHLLPSNSKKLTLKDARASETLFSMNSSVILREGCSLNTEFISAIFAALRRASALVGQNQAGRESICVCVRPRERRRNGREALGGEDPWTLWINHLFNTPSNVFIVNGGGIWKHNFDSTS